MYYKGEGVDKDVPQATEWFQKAAKQGHARAQSFLEKYCSSQTYMS